MYKDFYQMKNDPFSNRPMPEVFFESRPHTKVWQFLVDSLDTQEPAILVLGDYGTGKTTLCLRLVQALKEIQGDGYTLLPVAEEGHSQVQVLNRAETAPYVFFPTPDHTFAQMLNKVAYALGISPGADEMETQQRIVDHFERGKARKGLTILIDDAGELDVETLAKLRFLLDFVHDGFFPFHLVLFAHTSLLEKLKHPRLVPLLQRIKRRYYLDHLDLEETKEYIYFRLYKSGAPGMPSFSEDAVQRIYQATDGVPRLIHNLCDNCLLVGGSEKLTRITGPVVESVIRYLEGPESPETTPARAPGAEEPASSPEPSPPPREKAAPEGPADSSEPLIMLDMESSGLGTGKSDKACRRRIVLWVLGIFALGVVFSMVVLYRVQQWLHL